MFYGAESFPSRERDLFHMAQRCKKTQTQIADMSFCLKLYMTFACAIYACTGFLSSPKKNPDFCWLRLQQRDNSQTTGWRWTQPAQSSLLPSCSMHVCLSYCQTDSPLSAVVFSPLPLTTESWLRSNVKRIRSV